ncbi:MAG: hypothetical protein A3D92_19040 [Bacteroidetes bacterium RIFCSPHIGHO2_02_FULL_44_7]|nr:MAG: hypothetical protein A3D92_19040 [Bacteroidetes bacterium RIFCSPHIGHO2_02_FULL_44_7]
MISIQQMHYILVLSEELHFQRASERCFVTQPTLSMQLKKAEEILEAKLFDRTRNPIELTEFGEALLPIIRDTLSEYNRITDLFNRKKGTFKEELRVGIIPTVAGFMLPDLYTTWQEELLDVHLTIEELKTEEILKALDQKKIDVGILAGPVHDPKLRTIHLFQEEIRLYYPSTKAEEVQADALKNMRPWLLTSGNCLRTQMMNFCELRAHQQEWDYEGGNIELLLRMVELHGGYTLVPENYIQSSSGDYKRIVSLNGDVPAREIIALTPNRNGKWKQVERMLRSVQLRYSSPSKGKYQLLTWS